MFIKLFGYQLRRMLRSRSSMFWSLIFPLLLGTLFYLGFGSATKKDESFKTISVAIVNDVKADQEANYQSFLSTMKSLEYSDNRDMFKVKEISREEAKKQLDKETIVGYVIYDEKPSLFVKQSGISQTIIESFLNKYIRMSDILTEVATTNPEKLPEIVGTLNSELSHVAENQKDQEKDLDPMLGYFYALLAMTCIYGSFWGSDNVFNIKADISSLGMRRCVTPTNKMLLVTADALASIVLHSLEMLVVLCYLQYGLHINFGNQLGLVYLTCVLGSVIGISFGTFIGAVVKGSVNTRVGVVLGSSMLMCFLSGLMIVDIKYTIEKSAPILNRINPCTMIVDALYSLNVYDTMQNYWKSIISMLIVATLFCVGSALVLRRERYASL